MNQKLLDNFFYFFLIDFYFGKIILLSCNDAESDGQRKKNQEGEL